MGEKIPVFWLEPTDTFRVELRRYRNRQEGDAPCPLMPGEWSYHQSKLAIGEAPAEWEETDGRRSLKSLPLLPPEDPRWPRACACGYVFDEKDAWQTTPHLLYRAVGGGRDGQLFTLQDAPAGAMWNAEWFAHTEWSRGPDGLCLVVRLPNGGDWMPDSEASNCTRTQWGPTPERPNSKTWLGRTHYCWVRHGDPRQPHTLHVDKDGDTCSAGAGSILSGKWHGFLHHGHLIGD
jgi:hypothetical protein